MYLILLKNLLKININKSLYKDKCLKNFSKRTCNANKDKATQRLN